MEEPWENKSKLSEQSSMLIILIWLVKLLLWINNPPILATSPCILSCNIKCKNYWTNFKWINTENLAHQGPEKNTKTFLPNQKCPNCCGHPQPHWLERSQIHDIHIIGELMGSTDTPRYTWYTNHKYIKGSPV